jgi:acetyl esterase/lipase
MRKWLAGFFMLTSWLVSTPGARAREAAPDYLDAAVLLGSMYRIEPNLIYETAGGWTGKLDLYLPHNPSGPVPAYINFHGGGWVSGSKDEVALDVLPMLAMGFAVVNVDYRLARTAQAPAAVEDCRCALRWVVRHAAQYGLDARRLVVGGMSAGGHLALMTALATPADGFDRLCPGNEDLRVAAAVSFFGITDVPDLLSGANQRDFAVGWLGGLPQRDAIARAVSPIKHVRADAPPVMLIHGDADPVVPYAHALRLGAALAAAGVPHQLLTVRGGKHGDFGGDDMVRALHAIRAFLVAHRVLPQPAPSKPLARGRH